MERPDEYMAVRQQWERKEISARGAVRKLGITHNTILRWENKQIGENSTEN